MSGKLATGELGETQVKHWSKYNEALEEEISAAEIQNASELAVQTSPSKVLS